MVVTVGVATTVAPLVVFNPAEGDHEYVVAPLAVMLVLAPEQILALVGEVFTVGLVFTDTVTVCVVEQAPVVPVTV